MKETRETIELTSGMFAVLLNLTGSDPELQTNKLRSFVQALHRVELKRGNRWVVELTEEDIRAMHYIFGIRSLRASAQEASRHSNWLCRQSKTYLGVVLEEKEKEETRKKGQTSV